MFVAKRQTNTRASKTFSIQVKQQLTGREQKCELFGQPPSASKQKCKNLHLLKNSYTLGTQKPIQFTNWFTQKTLYLGHTQQTHNFKIQEPILLYYKHFQQKYFSNAKTYFIHKCKWYMKEISNLNIF